MSMKKNIILLAAVLLVLLPYSAFTLMKKPCLRIVRKKCAQFYSKNPFGDASPRDYEDIVKRYEELEQEYKKCIGFFGFCRTIVQGDLFLEKVHKIENEMYDLKQKMLNSEIKNPTQGLRDQK